MFTCINSLDIKFTLLMSDMDKRHRGKKTTGQGLYMSQSYGWREIIRRIDLFLFIIYKCNTIIKDNPELQTKK